MQYPKTQTHWKNEIFPPSNFVLMVTTKAPPHITRKTTPNSLPLELMPMLRTLHLSRHTAIAGGKGSKDPTNPLNSQTLTIAKFLNPLRIAFHIEFGDDHVSQFGQNVLEVSRLSEMGLTMVSQTSSSRVSECALTYACILFQIL